MEGFPVSKPGGNSDDITMPIGDREKIASPEQMDDKAAAQRSEGKEDDDEPLGERKIDIHRSEGHADGKERQEDHNQISDDKIDVVKQSSNRAERNTLRHDDSANSAYTLDGNGTQKKTVQGAKESGVKGKSTDLEKEEGGAGRGDKHAKNDKGSGNDTNNGEKSVIKPESGGNGTEVSTTNEQHPTEQIDNGKVPRQLKDSGSPKGDKKHDARSDTTSEDSRNGTMIVVNDKNGTAVNPETFHSGDNGTAGQRGFPKNGTQQNVESDSYFENPDTEFVTVIFHALLTPTFQFNHSPGDRIFIHGNYPFSWNEQRQVEVRIVR